MATGATEFVDKTISDGIFSPDIWSKQVLRATESNLLFAKSVNRGFENDATVGKTVKVADRQPRRPSENREHRDRLRNRR